MKLAILALALSACLPATQADRELCYAQARQPYLDTVAACDDAGRDYDDCRPDLDAAMVLVKKAQEACH